MNVKDKTPLKLVHCAMSTGIGGGIERMDALYNRYIDRSIVDPVFVAVRKNDPGVKLYDPSILFRYTGDESRFEKLLPLLAGADIVQFSGGFDPLVCEAARSSGAPVLIELMHLTEPGQIYPNIDVSVCVSETVRKAQPFREKTTVIHNGIDIENFPFNDDPDTGENIVMLESTRREKKMYFHLDEIADDIARIDPGAKLWLAGRGQTGESTDRVKFLGLRSDMAKLYRQADFLVMLSIKEPFGLIVLEAMASGCLPIVADDGGMAEMVTHGVDGWLVDAGDRRAVEEVIKEAISVHGSLKWLEMRRSAREKVEKEFSGRACLLKYEKLYRDMIELKGRRKERGSINVEAPPEADIADALHNFNGQLWGGVENSVRRMGARSAPIKIKQVADVARLLAKQSIAHGRVELADIIYQKLYESGFTDIEMMKEWVNVRAGSDSPIDFILRELMLAEPDNHEWVLLSAEQSLNSGDPAMALEILEKGVEAIPESDELASTASLLRRQLGK
ncbi:MAG TPA: glycosyltransferase [Nitrospirae bacterium]|nr:glycosyltransferase [Nitrospirota bacterium]